MADLLSSQFARMSDGQKAVASDKVWTVVLTDDSYLPGVLTLDYSLRAAKSQYPLVVLWTSSDPSASDSAPGGNDGGVGPATLAALDARGIARQRIERVAPAQAPDYARDPRFRHCWTKLAPWALTQYTRIVQLDADMLVMRNMDELMLLPLDPPPPDSEEQNLVNGHSHVNAVTNGHSNSHGRSNNNVAKDHEQNNVNGHSSASPASVIPAPGRRIFAAGHACVCNPLKKAHYPSDWIPANCAFTHQHAWGAELAGSLAIAPDVAPLAYMNGGLQVVNPSSVRWREIVAYMEREAGSMDFADQSLLSRLYRGRWVPLPYVYNALKPMRWDGVHRKIWRDEDVKNMHYILVPKPWEESDAEELSDETHKWWHCINKARKADEKRRGVTDGL